MADALSEHVRSEIEKAVDEIKQGIEASIEAMGGAIHRKIFDADEMVERDRRVAFLNSDPTMRDLIGRFGLDPTLTDLIIQRWHAAADLWLDLRRIKAKTARLREDFEQALIKQRRLFVMLFDGKRVRVASMPTGPEFWCEDIAQALGCLPDDLGVAGNFLITMDEVQSNLTNRGPTGARFRKWLNKSIKPSRLGIYPDKIRDGLMAYTLMPVGPSSEDPTLGPGIRVTRLKQDIAFTQVGIAVLERDFPKHLRRSPVPTLH
jgi:hypothetical protein